MKEGWWCGREQEFFRKRLFREWWLMMGDGAEIGISTLDEGC